MSKSTKEFIGSFAAIAIAVAFIVFIAVSAARIQIEEAKKISPLQKVTMYDEGGVVVREIICKRGSTTRHSFSVGVTVIHNGERFVHQGDYSIQDWWGK